MNTTAKAVVRLTIELPPAHAAELAALLRSHVSFLDFPWAMALYDALEPAMDLRDEDVFRDPEFGVNVFLERKQG